MLFAFSGNIKTCKASLSMTISLRVAPSIDQLLADSINYSESLRAKALAGSDDVMTVVLKMFKMPAFSDSLTNQIPNAQALQLCVDWGMRWHGKKIERKLWTSMQDIVPFCKDAGVLSALGEIKIIYPEIDQMTKLGSLCKAARIFAKGNFLIDEFQGKGCAQFSLEWALQCLHACLQFGDVPKSQVSTKFLVGDSAKEVGTIQVYFRKLQAIDYAWKHYRSSAAYDPAIGAVLCRLVTELGCLGLFGVSHARELG